MIDPLSFLVLILLATALSRLLLPDDRRVRLFWIVAPGVLLLFVTHPLALAFAIGCFLLGLGIFCAGRMLSSSSLKARLPYALLLLLFVPDVMGLASKEPILWLGSAFFIVRQMMTVAQGVKDAVPFRQFLPAMLMSTFFFGALPSGPVFSGLETWNLLKRDMTPRNGEGCFRLFEGLTYLMAIAGLCGVATDALKLVEAHLSGVVDIPISLSIVASLAISTRLLAEFGFLFATFYGYSRMAEGSALLLGFAVPQNFDKPHLARDLGDFWKRWHRSMADFVMQYIYLPLLVTTSRTKLALIAAFVFMGLWHNLSVNFLAWGLGHGVGLAYLLPWVKRRGINPLVLRIASLVYVVLLSSVAHGVWSG